MPRPAKLTPKISKLICDHVASGHSFKDAYTLANIGQTTFYRWREQGAPPDPDAQEDEAEQERRKPYRAFRDALARAESAFMDTHIRGIRDAALKTSETRHEEVVIEKAPALDGKGKPRYDVKGNQIMVEVSRREHIKRVLHPPNWNAHAWLLERKDPANWGRRMVEHAGRIDGDHKVSVGVAIYDDDDEDGPVVELPNNHRDDPAEAPTGGQQGE